MDLQILLFIKLFKLFGSDTSLALKYSALRVPREGESRKARRNHDIYRLLFPFCCCTRSIPLLVNYHQSLVYHRLSCHNVSSDIICNTPFLNYQFINIKRIKKLLFQLSQASGTQIYIDIIIMTFLVIQLVSCFDSNTILAFKYSGSHVSHEGKDHKALQTNEIY